MRCSKAQKRIALFVGGDATYRESESVKEHLIRCDVCAADYEAYDGSLRVLRMLRDRRTPGWFWEGFNTGVFRRIREAKAAAPRKPHAPFAHAGTALAAAVVLMLMFLFAWPFVRVEQAPPSLETPGVTQSGGLPGGYVLPSATADERRPVHEQEWFKPVDSSRSQEI